MSPAPSSLGSRGRLRKLWRGRGRPALRWRSLIGGVFVLGMSSQVFTIGLSTIKWAMPLKLVGVVSLVLAAGATFLGVRALVRVVVQLGLKRLLTLLAVLYFVVVILLGLVLETDKQGLDHWVASGGVVARWAIGGVTRLRDAVLQTPDAVSFAATGKRKPIKVAGGVEWIGDVPPTPILVPAPAADDISLSIGVPIDSQVAQPEFPSDVAAPVWQVGDRVRVVKTDGASLRARATPDLDAQVVARFPPDSRLQLVDGPKTVEGRIWWKVQGENIQGWCVADYLMLVE